MTTPKERSQQSSHISSVETMIQVKLRFNQATPSVAHQLNTETKEISLQNRSKVKSILKAFCARQNIPLCGHHHEVGLSLLSGEYPSKNP